MLKHVLIILILTFLNRNLQSQNEAKIWYFGVNAGLNFNTVPPTPLTNGSLNTYEGCATIADASGNLLFYTDGVTIWDKTHAIMANGTGLTGNSSSTQSGVIVRKPGSSNIYFVFTLGELGTGSLCVSTVDMSLASGNGSVTIKNTFLAGGMTEKLTSVKHCNGSDVWVMSHDLNSDNFRCYLVTSAGVNMTPVISSYGTIHSGPVPGNGALGYLKFSPNGRKLGLAIHSKGAFEIYDFDNSTGIVSNSLSLVTAVNNPYGCEFSPDGTKFYGTSEFGLQGFYQWDLCAGSNSAIIASKYTQSAPSQLMGMQVATDGKIYVAKITYTVIGVINNPNAAGAACNYNHNGQSIAPKTSRYGLPNFINSFFNTPTTPQSFAYSVDCAVVSYSAPAVIANTVNAGCSAIVAYTATGLQWNFGDPSSGIANTSALSNPSHSYSAPGNYTTQLVINYNCHNDTIRLPVNVPAISNLSVSGTFSVCKSDKSVYSVSGANSYTWSNNLNTTTVSLSPTVTTTYSVNGNTPTGCSGVKVFTVNVFHCIGINESNELINNLKVYPSPVKDMLKIEVPVKIKISLMNTIGKELLSETFAEGPRELDLSFLSAGIYFLRAIDDKGTVKMIRVIKTEQD